MGLWWLMYVVQNNWNMIHVWNYDHIFITLFVPFGFYTNSPNFRFEVSLLILWLPIYRKILGTGNWCLHMSEIFEFWNYSCTKDWRKVYLTFSYTQISIKVKCTQHYLNKYSSFPFFLDLFPFWDNSTLRKEKKNYIQKIEKY